GAHGAARDLVRSAATAFTAEAYAEPAIIALRSHVFEVLEGELERARARGAGAETEAALRHLAGVLLHGPSQRARELAAEGRVAEFADGLDALFGIRPAPTRRADGSDAAGIA
ncbi:MAG: glutamyl-tRNA reductase, partial [Rhodoglobus sp.]